MNVLLLRPDPGDERFGLGPFFRVEPLGLEYLGAALRAAGHEVVAADLRFPPKSAASWTRRSRARIVGISCAHALEFDRVLDTAREVRRASPDAFILVGGHAAAAYPFPFECDPVDAVCVDDAEEIAPMLADAIERGEPLDRVPGLRIRTADGWVSTPPLPERTPLDKVPLPARDLVARHRNGYHCLLFKPVWLVETARGCPHRCSFCSVWQLYGRSCRERSIAAVADDFASAGDSIFVADDLFWNNPPRSLELAAALKKRGIRKRWLLVQTRTDVIVRNPELLEAWRPLAEHFDIFLGLEAATDDGLSQLSKGAGVGDSVEAVRIARERRYGVNGNFLVDPDWSEDDFRDLWDFVSRHGLQRAGYTVLTPLPGTEYFESVRGRLEGQPWRKFDMHHVLWEPKLGAKRFFELYAETWRRSILNTAGDKKWTDWMKQVRPSQIPYLLRILWRTQAMMKPQAYLREHERAR
jgi:radical SAM superfamily enzyme YgiQ (UPF0313 family)